MRAHVSLIKEGVSLVEEGMELWKHESELYRILPRKFVFLRAEGRRLGIPLQPVPDIVLDRYPAIPLFEFWRAEDARAFLESLNVSELWATVSEAQETVNTHFEYSWEKTYGIWQVVPGCCAYSTLLGWTSRTQRILEYYDLTGHFITLGGGFAVEPLMCMMKEARKKCQPN